MSPEVRFGVVGCGEIAVRTCEGINAAPNAAIAMLVDARADVMSDLADFYGVPTTTDIDEMLSDPGVEAVYIATPHYLHAPQGILAAKAGKHVLVEKPMATTLKDADALIAACDEQGVKLGVAFAAQVDAGMAAARDLVRGGVIGDIIAVRLSALGDKPDHYWYGGYTRRVRTDWRTSAERSGGGILIMNIIHDLNTVRWVTGLEVQRLYAECDTLATPVEVEDTTGVVLRYDNNAIGVIQAGSLMRGGAHEDARGPRVYGTKGQLILGPKPLVYLTEPPEGSLPNTWQELRSHGPAGDRSQMAGRFAQAILEDTDPPVTGLDGRKALEIVLAAYRSGELGRPVEFPLGV